MKTFQLISALTYFVLTTTAATTYAQVAGSSTSIGISVEESTSITTGWSVKKSILGKNVYNDQGTKIGSVQDIILSPDRKLTYAIVGAGGFIGIGRHDVAIPASQIQNRDGKLLLPGATKDTVKSLPTFVYANNSMTRDKYIASAESDIAKAKALVANQEKKSATAAADAKAKLEAQIAALQNDLKSTEAKLAEMKSANVTRWREFEAGVTAATARLRKMMNEASA